MGVLRVLAAVGVAASAVVSVVSCSSNATPDGGGTIPDASTPPVPTSPVVDSSAPVVEDASDAAVPKADASDANPPTSACSVFLPVGCNFEDLAACPAYASIGISEPGGNSGFVADAGTDGSKAFFGSATAEAGGGFYGMPFFDIAQPGIDPSTTFPGCQVVCEANLRVASGGGSGASIVLGSEFSLDVTDAGYVERSADASAQNAPTVSSEWTHVRLVLTPTATGATSQITVIDSLDASTTTSVPVSKVGTGVRLGVSSNGPSATDLLVYVDDVSCAIRDVATP